MIIAIAAIKGGVGKTTLTFCLAAALTHMGKRVLCIDLDHQGDLSAALGADKNESQPNIGKILHAPKRAQADMLASGIIDIPGWCHLITPGEDLGSYQAEIEKGLSSESRLRDALKGFNDAYENYDYVLLDTPKGEGLFTKNALVACDHIVVPVQTEYLALKNIPDLLSLVSQIADRSNPDVKVSVLVPNRMKQTSLHKSIYDQLTDWDITEQLPQQADKPWTAPPIKDLTIYAELSAQGQSLYTYSGAKKEQRAPFEAIAKHLESLRMQANKKEVVAVG
jgi:chromosome partitioning protein